MHQVLWCPWADPASAFLRAGWQCSQAQTGFQPNICESSSVVPAEIRQDGLPGLASLSSQHSTAVGQFERDGATVSSRGRAGDEAVIDEWREEALDLEGELENSALVLANIVWHIGYFP